MSSSTPSPGASTTSTVPVPPTTPLLLNSPLVNGSGVNVFRKPRGRPPKRPRIEEKQNETQLDLINNTTNEPSAAAPATAAVVVPPQSASLPSDCGICQRLQSCPFGGPKLKYKCCCRVVIACVLVVSTRQRNVVGEWHDIMLPIRLSDRSNTLVVLAMPVYCHSRLKCFFCTQFATSHISLTEWLNVLHRNRDVIPLMDQAVPCAATVTIAAAPSVAPTADMADVRPAMIPCAFMPCDNAAAVFCDSHGCNLCEDHDQELHAIGQNGQHQRMTTAEYVLKCSRSVAESRKALLVPSQQQAVEDAGYVADRVTNAFIEKWLNGQSTILHKCSQSYGNN